MDSNVKLADGAVELEGNVVVRGTDLMVDAGADPARRTNQQPFRRALVHDYGDRLTLNWGKDYPAGVFIDGDVRIGDCLRTDTMSSEDPSRPLVVNGVLSAHELESSHLSVPGGHGAIFKIEFAAAGPQHEGRFVLSSSWAGTPWMHCDVKVLGLQNPAVTTGSPVTRAALTHTDADELVLNDGEHYAGGVGIRGAAKLDSVAVGGAATFNQDVSFGKSLKIGNVTIGTSGATVPPQPHVPGATRKLDITASDIRATTTQPSLPGHPPVVEVLDLIAEIRALRQRVAVLESKLAPVPA